MKPLQIIAVFAILSAILWIAYGVIRVPIDKRMDAFEITRYDHSHIEEREVVIQGRWSFYSSRFSYQHGHHYRPQRGFIPQTFTGQIEISGYSITEYPVNMLFSRPDRTGFFSSHLSYWLPPNHPIHAPPNDFFGMMRTRRLFSQAIIEVILWEELEREDGTTEIIGSWGNFIVLGAKCREDAVDMMRRYAVPFKP